MEAVVAVAVAVQARVDDCEIERRARRPREFRSRVRGGKGSRTPR